MKVTPYQTPILFREQKNNRVIPFVKETSCKDVVSFGHSLDDEKEEKEESLRKIKNEISTVENAIATQKSSSSREINTLDEEINQTKGSIDPLSVTIKNLSNKQQQKDDDISDLETDTYNSQKSIEENKSVMAKLQEEQKQILKIIDKDNLEAEEIHSKMMKELIIQKSKDFNLQMEKALAGPKNTLIQKIINPVISESEGDDIKIPPGILLHSKSNDVPKTFFEWIVKKTNSNYSIMDAADFQDKSGLIKMINYVAEKSKKAFELNRSRTFTFIDNFNSCANVCSENKPLVEPFENLFKNISEKYHNTIIAFAEPSRLYPSIVKNEHFPLKISLDEDFIQDKRLGYQSIIEDLKNLKTEGKNFLFLSFETLHSRV